FTSGNKARTSPLVAVIIYIHISRSVCSVPFSDTAQSTEHAAGPKPRFRFSRVMEVHGRSSALHLHDRVGRDNDFHDSIGFTLSPLKVTIRNPQFDVELFTTPFCVVTSGYSDLFHGGPFHIRIFFESLRPKKFLLGRCVLGMLRHPHDRVEAEGKFGLEGCALRSVSTV
ncbi:hypothetical protein P171DRAFT_508290, partial [Karstenula rhodostoma CBS 690.94]